MAVIDRADWRAESESYSTVRIGIRSQETDVVYKALQKIQELHAYQIKNKRQLALVFAYTQTVTLINFEEFSKFTGSVNIAEKYKAQLANILEVYLPAPEDNLELLIQSVDETTRNFFRKHQLELTAQNFKRAREEVLAICSDFAATLPKTVAPGDLDRVRKESMATIKFYTLKRQKFLEKVKDFVITEEEFAVLGISKDKRKYLRIDCLLYPMLKLKLQHSGVSFFELHVTLFSPSALELFKQWGYRVLKNSECPQKDDVVIYFQAQLAEKEKDLFVQKQIKLYRGLQKLP